MMSESQLTFQSHSLPSGVNIFYRAAGDPASPVLLLLHGFPTASHMFRDLIPHLARRYRVIAPDLPGFGETSVSGDFTYTFANIASAVDELLTALGIERFAVYVFDYGAPVGLRLALKRPEKVTAFISQNGNAYEEGLSSGWAPIRAYWSEPTAEHRAQLRALLTPESVRWQYTHGAEDRLVSPDGYTLDSARLARPGVDDIQLDLFKDYATNVELYPTFQKWLRESQVPVLAAWGKNDPFFLPAGAEAYRRDIPSAEVHFLETGHFALATHSAEIGDLVLDFLDRNVQRESAQNA